MPFFEPLEKLDPKHVDLERARKSLREELEAIDFYQERIDATEDESLKELLTHNMNEDMNEEKSRRQCLLIGLESMIQRKTRCLKSMIRR